jgi:hypothetical protein
MKTEITIVGHGANGALRLAVSLPDGDDAECYTHYHSGYFVAEETRERLRESLVANYSGYQLADIINRDYGDGYTVYTVEVTPKTPLETLRMATGHFPLANIGNGLQCRFWCVSGDMPIYPLNRFPACRVARG